MTIATHEAQEGKHMRLSSDGEVKVGDFERTPYDYAVAGRTAEEAVVRVDLREPLGEALLDRRDPLGRYHSALAHWSRCSATAAALRRMPAAPGRTNGVSP